MKCTACSRRLHDYVDGELTAAEMREIDAHLARCMFCERDLASLHQLRRATNALPREVPPQRDLWAELQQRISSGESPAAERNADRGLSVVGETDTKTPARSRALQWFAPLAMAASIVFLATVVERRYVPRTPSGWSVAALSGTPQVDARAVRDNTRMRVGQWLVTDDASRAKVLVGEIGEVSVEPNSRLRLLGVKQTDHRLELERGTMNAMIWAPPRLFFVNTPSATAVDLGCAYTLTVGDNGDGELHVTLGFVALEDQKRGRESIIRTGMMCLTRKGVGPGTPFAVDAPPPLREALARFDFDADAATTALSEVLAAVRPEDTITLWHLLDRTEGAERAAVYDRLAHYSAPPPGVTRQGILSDDKVMLRTWGSALGIDRF